MKGLLFFLMVCCIGNTGYGQALAREKEVLVGYSILDLADADKITKGIDDLDGAELKMICYNHNVVIVKCDPQITDIVDRLFHQLKSLETSSMPEFKDGTSQGLICDTEVPLELTEKRAKAKP